MQDTYQEVIIVLIACTFVFLCFSGILLFIVLFYQKKKFQHRHELTEIKNTMEKELLRTKLESQEETYQQIGEELHDNVAQLLSSAKLLLGITERALASPPDTLITAEETLTAAIQEIRSLSKSLSKEWLGQFNLVENLRIEAARINTAKFISTTIQSDEKFLPLTADMQVITFRIVQEALQNCVKHAQAKSILVTIVLHAHEVEITVKDDCVGFYLGDQQHPGIGITNMTRRTKLLDGKLDWSSVAGKGTMVSIHLPVKNTL
jgi:signal transduction histidine kinase